MNEIAARLFDAIQQSKLSYADLSQCTGIPKATIQRYATGKTDDIPVSRIILLAKALNVSAEWILGWDEEKSALALSERVQKRIHEDTDFREIIDILSNSDLRTLKAIKRLALDLK